jgi:hypothetical protein
VVVTLSGRPPYQLDEMNGGDLICTFYIYPGPGRRAIPSFSSFLADKASRQSGAVL